MDALELTQAIAGPIGSMGAAYYFAPESAAVAERAGLDLGALYAAGRGGVMGDASPEEIEEVFHFFKPPMVSAMVRGAAATATPAQAADLALEGARSFGAARLAELDPAVRDAFADAGRAAIAAAPRGRWPLFDGYAERLDADDPGAAAYLVVVALRELRGGLHTEAIKAAGIPAATACQLDPNPISFPLHGYGDDDRVEETGELLAAKQAAEEATDAGMVEILSKLSDPQRAALAAGVAAMEPLVGGHVG
jgi:hypothetical protein